MSDYELDLPWPPSVNQWKTPFRGRMILTKKGREYRQKVSEIMGEIGLSGEMVSERLCVHMELNAPTARKYDADNFCKSVFDALTKCGFWEDDELIDKLVITKGDKCEKKVGKVTLKVFVLF